MRDFWREQAAWSQATFGPDDVRGPAGPLKHLRKEIDEVLAAPADIEEYADLLFLVFDATRRAGFVYDDLLGACWDKLFKNKQRTWPDWRALPTDVAIEHDRSVE